MRENIYYLGFYKLDLFKCELQSANSNYELYICYRSKKQILWIAINLKSKIKVKALVLVQIDFEVRRNTNYKNQGMS